MSEYFYDRRAIKNHSLSKKIKTKLTFEKDSKQTSKKLSKQISTKFIFEKIAKKLTLEKNFPQKIQN